jgi:hypothetical protein
LVQADEMLTGGASTQPAAISDFEEVGSPMRGRGPPPAYRP